MPDDPQSSDGLNDDQTFVGERETPPEAGTTTHGLRELLLKFEAEHPQFSELLGRIADGLSRMGI